MGGNKIDNVIELQVSTVLDWLKSQYTDKTKRFAGLLALTSLLIEAPYTTFKKLFQTDIPHKS